MEEGVWVLVLTVPVLITHTPYEQRSETVCGWMDLQSASVAHSSS
jgi:hypothetical protein